MACQSESVCSQPISEVKQDLARLVFERQELYFLRLTFLMVVFLPQTFHKPVQKCVLYLHLLFFFVLWKF